MHGACSPLTTLTLSPSPRLCTTRGSGVPLHAHGSTVNPRGQIAHRIRAERRKKLGANVTLNFDTHISVISHTDVNALPLAHARTRTRTHTSARAQAIHPSTAELHEMASRSRSRCLRRRSTRHRGWALTFTSSLRAAASCRGGTTPPSSRSQSTWSGGQLPSTTALCHPTAPRGSWSPCPFPHTFILALRTCS